MLAEPTKNFLLIESSTSLVSVTIQQDTLNNSPPLYHESITVSRRETSPLFAMTQRAVKNIFSNTNPPTHLLVGTGPGSYNGIRAGISLAAGMALAWGIPYHGICSLLGTRLQNEKTNTHTTPYALCGDARGGQVFYAILERTQSAAPRLLAPPILTTRKEALQQAATQHLPIYFFGEQPAIEIHGPLLARAAAYEANRTSPTPLYLKPPHITPSKKSKPRFTFS
ncbi:MAG: tRNA (adenosine(37)-N6)-threonylcarbamoyltransferase complex dimerization subunit type 1 TsaB [Chthoniobacterales bacterium]